MALNTLPTWALALLVVGGAVCIGLGGFLPMRRFVQRLAEHADSRSLSSALSISPASSIALVGHEPYLFRDAENARVLPVRPL